MKRLKILFMQDMEETLESLIHVLESLRERCAVCAACGQNRYTGKPCVNYEVSN